MDYVEVETIKYDPKKYYVMYQPWPNDTYPTWEADDSTWDNLEDARTCARDLAEQYKSDVRIMQDFT